jgi:hypothetical protein
MGVHTSRRPIADLRTMGGGASGLGRARDARGLLS